MGQNYINMLKVCKYFGLSSALNALVNSQCHQFTKVIGIFFHRCMFIVAQGLHTGFSVVLVFSGRFFLSPAMQAGPTSYDPSYHLGFYVALL